MDCKFDNKKFDNLLLDLKFYYVQLFFNYYS